MGAPRSSDSLKAELSEKEAENAGLKTENRKRYSQNAGSQPHWIVLLQKDSEASWRLRDSGTRLATYDLSTVDMLQDENSTDDTSTISQSVHRYVAL
jgi:hypothetical protein